MNVKNLGLLKVAHHLAHVEEMCEFLVGTLEALSYDSNSRGLVDDVINGLIETGDAAGAAAAQIMGDAV